MNVQFYHPSFDYNDNYTRKDRLGVSVEAHRIVCPTCNGNGRHFRKDLDENLMLDSIREDGDEDSMQAYMSGAFDQRCTECDGKNVVDSVDWDKAPKWIQEAIYEYNQEKAHDEQVRRAECGYAW